MTDTEMKRFLAEKCMGWTYEAWPEDGHDHPLWCWKRPDGVLVASGWNPISSISDVFQAVEKMRELGWRFRLLDVTPNHPNAKFWRFDLTGWDASAETICRAICLAAIAALEGK